MEIFPKEMVSDAVWALCARGKLHPEGGGFVLDRFIGQIEMWRADRKILRTVEEVLLA